jgi:hypothetical protein
MQIAARHGQPFRAAVQMDLGGFVVGAYDVADRAQVDHDRAVDLGELSGIELGQQLFQRQAEPCTVRRSDD